MSTGEFYPMDYEAWDAGTFELTLEEEGAYLRLVHQMYRRKQPIHNNPKFLAHIWRCHVNKAKALVKRLITLNKIVLTSDDLLRNVRVEHELAVREEKRKKKIEAGKVGGKRSADVRTTHPPYYDVAPPYIDHPDTKLNEINAKNEALSTNIEEKKEEENPPPTPLRGDSAPLSQFEIDRKKAQRKAIANAKRKASPRTRIAPDFEPDEVTLAAYEKFDVDPDEFIPQFIDKHVALGMPQADWQLACRTYARNVAKNREKDEARNPKWVDPCG